MFFCIPMSAADSPAINPNDIITFLANGLFFIKNRIAFRNGQRSLRRSHPDRIV